MFLHLLTLTWRNNYEIIICLHDHIAIGDSQLLIKMMEVSSDLENCNFNHGYIYYFASNFNQISLVHTLPHTKKEKQKQKQKKELNLLTDQLLEKLK